MSGLLPVCCAMHTDPSSASSPSTRPRLLRSCRSTCSRTQRRGRCSSITWAKQFQMNRGSSCCSTSTASPRSTRDSASGPATTFWSRSRNDFAPHRGRVTCSRGSAPIDSPCAGLSPMTARLAHSSPRSPQQRPSRSPSTEPMCTSRPARGLRQEHQRRECCCSISPSARCEQRRPMAASRFAFSTRRSWPDPGTTRPALRTTCNVDLPPASSPSSISRSSMPATPHCSRSRHLPAGLIPGLAVSLRSTSFHSPNEPARSPRSAHSSCALRRPRCRLSWMQVSSSRLTSP